MKKLAIVFSLCSLFLFNNLVFGQQDPKAKVILDEVSIKTKSYKTMKIEFSYKMENKNEKINESKSGILFVKGDKYKLEFGEQTVYCDGKTVWTYLKESNEVQINNVQKGDDALNPVQLLNSYEKNYKFKHIKTEKQSGKNVDIVELYPNKSKSFIKIKVIIDNVAKQIVSSSMQDKKGSTFTYTSNKLTPNVELADTYFNFNKAEFPGVEEVDMR